MPLAQTLERVREDIRTGDFGKACARLHGLIGSYPDNLDLRRQLGEVYWNLHMPAMAGRYWYLVENKDERMQAACKRFEDEFRKDPYKILFALKFKGDEDTIKGTYAGRVLEDLERRVSQKYPEMPHVRANLSAKNRLTRSEPRVYRIRDLILKLGCFIAIAVLVFFVIIGALTTISTVVKWLR